MALFTLVQNIWSKVICYSPWPYFMNIPTVPLIPWLLILQISLSCAAPPHLILNPYSYHSLLSHQPYPICHQNLNGIKLKDVHKNKDLRGIQILLPNLCRLPLLAPNFSWTIVSSILHITDNWMAVAPFIPLIFNLAYTMPAIL